MNADFFINQLFSVYTSSLLVTNEFAFKPIFISIYAYKTN